MTITVRVPATSANLGPGFDCMGLALDLYNTFTIRLGQSFAIDVTGEAANQLPRTRDNFVVQSMERVFDEVAIDRVIIPDYALVLDNQIPVSSGLGSSASAIVAGLMLGNELVRHVAPDAALSRAALLDIATDIEGHPDNVAPALMGGGVLAFHNRAGLQTVGFPIPTRLRFVAVTPDFELSTDLARQALPASYSRRDVIENVAQSARVMLALSQNDLDMLQGGILDYVHEPYRKPLIPGADRVVDAALKAGALAVTISGAGPSLLAWCTDDTATQVGDEMASAWKGVGIQARPFVLSVQRHPTEVHVRDARAIE